MTPQFLTELSAHINRKFAEAEHRHDICIPDEDKDFLTKLMPQLITSYIDKFVQGAVEHHDSPFLSMSPDQMIQEAIKESTDLPFYLYGYFRAKAARR